MIDISNKQDQNINNHKGNRSFWKSGLFGNRSIWKSGLFGKRLKKQDGRPVVLERDKTVIPPWSLYS